MDGVQSFTGSDANGIQPADRWQAENEPGVGKGAVSGVSSAVRKAEGARERVAGRPGQPPAVGESRPSSYLEVPGSSCDSQESGSSDDPWEEVPGSLTHEVRACRCRSGFCPHCCKRVAFPLRKAVVEVVETFQQVQMWHLTLDPTHFEGPEEAFRYLRDKRCVARLMRALRKAGFLHSERFFYAYEWHQNGWPHIHLLVDASFIPIEVVREAWNQFIPPGKESRGFGFGWVEFSSEKWRSRGHAAWYCTKYLTKVPDYGFPEWVLKFKGNILRYGHSRPFFPKAEPELEPGDVEPEADQAAEKCYCGNCEESDLVCGRVCPEKPWWQSSVDLVADDPSILERAAALIQKERRPVRRRTIEERIADCGTGAVVVEKTVVRHRESGVEKARYRLLGVPLADYGECLEKLGIERSQFPWYVGINAYEVQQLKNLGQSEFWEEEPPSDGADEVPF